MADHVFQQIQQSFYIPADNDVQTARTGYLLPADESNPPPTIMLADALKQDGFFIFVPALPQGAGLKLFIDTARSYLTTTAPAGTRFAWFPDPAAQGDAFSGTTLQVEIKGGDYSVAEAVFISAAPNMLLRINGGAAITLNGDGGLTLTPPSGTANALYVTPQGSPDPQILDLATPLNLALLGSGATNGCFGFQVVVVGQWLNYLDIGLRLFYKDAYWGTTDSFRYPLFSEENDAFTLYATLDPLAPGEAVRSFFAFLDPAAAQASAPPTLTTYYRTNLGHAVALTPSGVQTRLIFAAKSTPNPTLYLVPSGDFLTGATSAGQLAATSASSLMCGLSGVEYIRLETDGSGKPITTISFTAGQPAFAKGFSPGAAGTQDNLTLTGDMTTAWAYVHRPPTAEEPGTIVYYAQPDNAVLYKHNDASRASEPPPDPIALVNSALVYMEVPSIYLPAATAAAVGGPPLAFPMLPYGNIQGDLAAIGQLEFELVSPARKDTINQIAKAHAAQAPAWLTAELARNRTAAADPPPQGVTPQGLLATYTADYATLTDVVLARTEPSTGRLDDNQLLLQSMPRNSDLWNALQSNQLFLVVTDPAALKDHMSGIIRVQDWEFHLTPESWRTDTVLIFKFFNNKTLRDLARDTGSWTLPNQFNKNDLPSALAVLDKAIQYAINQCCGPTTDCFASGTCPGAADFQYFIYSVLRNPLWNGILALNVGIPPTDLPDQLKSLAAGIDKSQFFAHHVGINASPVNYNASTKMFEMQRSSIFGLINYDDPRLLAATIDYSFKVLTLKVLFQNSAIADFASRVDLQVNRIFGEQVQLKDGTNNNLLFNGVYQDHDGTPAYVFTNQSANLFVVIASQVINSVTFSEGQFITLTPQAGATRIKARFVFWGSVDFKALKGFDAFSFGSDEQTLVPGQLAFSNVAITMDFDQARPEQQTFAFDTSHLAYDLARSQARPTSLYGHFPLKLTAFLDASTGTMPTDQGFMSVSSPLTQGTLVNPWYGLQFELELGSPGALAEQAGFVADLLVAWSPAYGGDYNVFVGLKLPGSSGNKREISLQGLLKIRIKNIQFTAAPSKDKDGKDTVSYLLRLQTITLSFMSLSLPPSGRIDFLLFGDPNATGDNRTLGWYAVFDKGVKPRPKKPTPIPGFGGTGKTLPPGGG
jgi:hypothetical protein